MPMDNIEPYELWKRLMLGPGTIIKIEQLPEGHLQIKMDLQTMDGIGKTIEITCPQLKSGVDRFGIDFLNVIHHELSQAVIGIETFRSTTS